MSTLPIKRKPLTLKQKIKVLRTALELFGPDGEHWTKRKYFGKRIRKGASTYEVQENADCWCLVGAIYEASCRLGITKERGHADYYGRPLVEEISITGLIKETSPFETGEGWNDARGRTFEDVKGLIEKRISQLEG